MNDLTKYYKGNEAGANFAFLINEWQHYKILAMQGGTRSGKTYSVLEFIIWLCSEYNGLVVSIVRETLPSLRASVLRDFKEIMERLGYWSDGNFNKTEFEYRFNGNLIEFFSVDNEQKVRGRKRHLLYCNEVNEISKEKLLQLLLRTEGICLMDYNPSMEESYIYDEVLQRPDTCLMVTDYTDNKYLSQTIINEIERLKTTDPEAWKIYGQGQRGEGRRGLIYPKWSRTTDFPDYLPFWYGVDFGFSNDPTAIIRIAFDKSARTLYLKEVVYQTQLLNSDIARIIKQDIRSIRFQLYEDVYYDNSQIKIGDNVVSYDEYLENRDILAKFIGDSIIAGEVGRMLNRFEKYLFDIYCDREPKSIRELRVAGLSAYPAMKGIGSVASQISFMYNFRVLYDGENIDKEKKSYKWRDKKGEQTDEPLDANNHAMDAARYGTFTHLVRNGFAY